MVHQSPLAAMLTPIITAATSDMVEAEKFWPRFPTTHTFWAICLQEGQSCFAIVPQRFLFVFVGILCVISMSPLRYTIFVAQIVPS